MLDSDSTTSIVILVVLLVLHAIFAAAKEAIASFRKSRRLQLIEEGSSAAQMVDNMAEDATRLLATEQLVLKFLGFFIVALAAFVYAAPLADILSISSFSAVVLITVMTIMLTLLFGELIPKEVARNFAEPLALWLIYPFTWLSYVAAPLVRVVIVMGRLLTGRWDKVQDDSFVTITEEDLRTYVDAGEEEGVLKETEKEMIYSIFDLDDTLAREIMIPRIDVVAVEAEATVINAMRSILQAGHSRAPVFGDSIDDIKGIIYIKDLVEYLLDGGETKTIRGLAREVYYVPESKPVSVLLRELQSKRVHIAIVVDEYGGTAGLVTIEDILEEIVGEIQDEHDADEFYSQKISDDEYIFAARMDLDDINNLMSIDLPTEDSDTLGGLVYDMLGRIPQTGETLSGDRFDIPNLMFTVLAVDGRRIERVKIERVDQDRDHVNDQAQDGSDANPTAVIHNRQNPLSNSP